ncbi:MAG: TetR/AcrR family transcriptional regulator [Longimicrobiales bacterium]
MPTNRGRERPIARATPDTRSRLLVVATRHFARRGFHGTGLRIVAREAHTSLGSVRYHFGDKAGLYRAVLAERLGVLRATVALREPSRDELRPTLFALAREMCTSPDTARLFLRAALDPPDLAGDEVRVLVACLADVIEGSAGGSHVVVRDPRTLASECLCVAAASSLLPTKDTDLPPLDPESLALYLLDLVTF